MRERTHISIRVPSDLKSAAHGILVARRQKLQDYLEPFVCAALHDLLALGTGPAEALDVPGLLSPAPLDWCQEGTRRCTAGSPEEPAAGSVSQLSRRRAEDAGGRGRSRNGGRGATPRLAPPTSI